jgi:hypothetical protein
LPFFISFDGSKLFEISPNSDLDVGTYDIKVVLSDFYNDGTEA